MVVDAYERPSGYSSPYLILDAYNLNLSPVHCRMNHPWWGGPVEPEPFYDAVILLVQDGIQLLNVASYVFCEKELLDPISSASPWGLIQLPQCQMRQPMGSIASLGTGRQDPGSRGDRPVIWNSMWRLGGMSCDLWKGTTVLPWWSHRAICAYFRHLTSRQLELDESYMKSLAQHAAHPFCGRWVAF